MIKAKSIRDVVLEDDRFRALIDPVWPKGVSRERTLLNAWLRDLAPSPELQARFSDNLLDGDDFVLLHSIELDRNHEYFKHLQDRNHHSGLTHLHGSPDKDQNAAVALKMLLEKEDSTPGNRDDRMNFLCLRYI